MTSGEGRPSAAVLLVSSALTAACVSIPFDARPGVHSGEGSFIVEPARIEAASETLLRLTMIVGRSGLVAGGGFRVELPVDPVHRFHGFTPPHIGFRHYRGFVECLAMRDGEKVGDAVAWADGGEAGCELKTGSLLEGDLLVLEYWGLAPRAAGTMPLHIESRYSGGGGGLPPAMPPVITVIPRAARSLHAVLPGAVAAGAPMTLAIVALDPFGNRAVDYQGAVEVRLGAARLTHEFKPEERGVALLSGLSVEQPGFARAEVTELGVAESMRLAAVSNPVRVRLEPASTILWGDLHFHTGTGAAGRAFMQGPMEAGDHRGNYTRAEDAYAYARDVSRLDFAGATEHAVSPAGEEAWQMSLRAATGANEAGRFTTFAAFQWKDHLVYLPGDEGRMIRSDDRLSDEPAELAARLAQYGMTDALLVRLAVAVEPGALSRAQEVYSWKNRGRRYEDDTLRFEPVGPWPVEAAPITLMAGSDDHWGMPGGDDQTGLEPGAGGLTAVEASRNDRTSILDSLRRGRAWATTGARILLLAETHEDKLELAAAGTAPFERIDLVFPENGGRRVIPIATSPGIDFATTIELPRANERGFCYVRAVQVNGEIAWSRLIEVGGENR